MLNFIKKIFGSKPAETPAPYKVEPPKLAETAPVADAIPFPVEKTTAKKTVKKATTRKPRAPRAPKA